MRINTLILISVILLHISSCCIPSQEDITFRVQDNENTHTIMNITDVAMYNVVGQLFY